MLADVPDACVKQCLVSQSASQTVCDSLRDVDFGLVSVSQTVV